MTAKLTIDEFMVPALDPGIVSIDMLCLPKGDTRRVEGMKPVSGADDWPLPR